jgi:hypothetical protein
MADVFISYKSEDREWASKVDALIRSAGYTTWWDPSLQGGERYNDRIDAELRSAKAAVVIWSERSWASTWVKEEALFARDREKLLPTRIDAVEIGVPFYSLQTVDLREWDGDPSASPAKALLEGLERQVPKKLRRDYVIYVYWTRGNDGFVPNEAKLERFLERVVALCSTIGVSLHLVKAWDHIVNPHMIADRSVYERDLNILVFFGRIEIDGFAEDVFCPGLRHLARELNPYVLHVGHEDFSLDYLNFYCMPQRKVETKDAKLPEPDTVLGDSAVEALAWFIAFRVLKVREVVGSLNP